MNVNQRFELLKLVRDDGIRSFLARDTGADRQVLVHLFPNAPSLGTAALLTKLDGLSSEQRSRIVDRGEHEGAPYVVTDRLAEFSGVREWLAGQTAGQGSENTPLAAAGAWKTVARPPEGGADPESPVNPEAVPNPEAVTNPEAPPNLDEQFASLFEPADRPVLPERSKSELPTAPPEDNSPGEFTRMFRVASRTPPPPPLPSPPSPVPPSPLATEPGEFTRMLQSPFLKKPESPTQLPAAEPGEFTRMFQKPSRSPDPPPLQPGLQPRSTDTPGEFTQFFEGNVARGPMPQSPAVRQPLTPQLPGVAGANREGDFTRIFGRRDLVAGMSNPAPAISPVSANATQAFEVPLPTPSPVREQQGPSDFTRMFSVAAPLTLGQPSPDSPASAAPEPTAVAPAKPSRLPLILGIVAVVMLVAAIILFLISRK